MSSIKFFLFALSHSTSSPHSLSKFFHKGQSGNAITRRPTPYKSSNKKKAGDGDYADGGYNSTNKANRFSTAAILDPKSEMEPTVIYLITGTVCIKWSVELCLAFSESISYVELQNVREA